MKVRKESNILTSVQKFTFENGCGEFKIAMKANAVLLAAGCGCFWAIIDEDDKENGVIINRTFYSVQTGDDLGIVGEPEKDWAVNYVGSWDEYHLFELIPFGGNGYEVPVEQA